jgi:hypothetical protein
MSSKNPANFPPDRPEKDMSLEETHLVIDLLRSQLEQTFPKDKPEYPPDGSGPHE